MPRSRALGFTKLERFVNSGACTIGLSKEGSEGQKMTRTEIVISYHEETKPL